MTTTTRHSPPVHSPDFAGENRDPGHGAGHGRG